MMKIPFKHTIKISGLLILAAFTLAACSLPIQGAETNKPEVVQPITVAVEPSSPVVDVISIPINEELEEAVEEVEKAVDGEEEAVEEPSLVAESVNTADSTVVITDTEKAGLIFMREEEKLAHDVYLALYELWGLPLFQNIARSEETHTNAVKRLLDTFAIPDPADQSPPGTFQDQALQDLYDQLVVLGANSLSDALKVGAVIEEIDILDLQKYLTETTNPEIQRVYGNLLRGSENHLRAFTSTLLQQTGETYQPQYLDASTYDGILASAPERGVRNNNRRP